MGFATRETFWAAPPPGLTVTLARIGPDIYEMFTYRCEQNSGCYALEYSKNADAAKRAIEGHICPATPEVGKVPNGKTVVQKLWDELDSLISWIKENDEEPETRTFMGQAQGIALALALLSVPWFRSKDDILRQANKRWRMQQNEIPWEATPGYNCYPAAPLAYVQAPEPKVQPVKRATPKAVKATKVPSARDFTVDERAFIRDSVHGETVAVETLALMYGVSEERIRSIAGSKPSTEGPTMLNIALF